MEVDNEKLTPLDYALLGGENGAGHTEVVDYLLERGAVTTATVKETAAICIVANVRGFLTRKRTKKMIAELKRAKAAAAAGVEPKPGATAAPSKTGKAGATKTSSPAATKASVGASAQRHGPGTTPNKTQAVAVAAPSTGDVLRSSSSASLKESRSREEEHQRVQETRRRSVTVLWIMIPSKRR